MSSHPNFIFDLNGTVADLCNGYAEMFSTVFGRFGMAYDPAKVPDYADTLLEDLFSQYNTGCTCKFRDFITLSVSSFERFVMDGAKKYDDCTVLDELAAEGCRLGIVSRNFEEHIRRIVSEIGLEGRFASIVGTDRSFMKRPDPYALNTCISEMGVPKESVFLVSTRPLDMDTGVNAGIKTVFIQREGSNSLDTKADFTIHSLSEIWELSL